MPHDEITLEQRWGLAERSARFGVWDLDTRTQTVHYSPQWKAMLGYPATEAPDRTETWRSRVHPDDLQPMLAALEAHIEGRAPAYEHEFRLRAADGSYRWMLSRGRVVAHDAQGRALRVIGTLTDRTEGREHEASRLARDRSAAADAARIEVLSRMSHELRTPLNAVLGFAQLLSQHGGTIDPATRHRYVENIEHAGWHLLKLIDEVLVGTADAPARGRADAQR